MKYMEVFPESEAVKSYDSHGWAEASPAHMYME